MTISDFIKSRLCASTSSDPQRQRMVVTLKMIVGVHRDDGGRCCGCDRLWPCLTTRHVATTWRDHPDYDHAWHRAPDDLPQRPLTDAEKTYLIEHGAVPADPFEPDRLAEAQAEIEASLERANYVMPVQGPYGLREVIEALPDLSHGELVALLNAPHVELDGDTPVEFLADGGSAWVVMEVLLGMPIQEVAERASQLWPLSRVPRWLVSSNEDLDGARPIDVLRIHGVEAVHDALDQAERRAAG